jgi:nitroreductase
MLHPLRPPPQANGAESMSTTTSGTSVMDAIYGRCSVRSYASYKPDRATVSALLEAAVRAPTAMHEEPWSFVVIQDQNILKRLSERASQAAAAEARQSTTEHGKEILARLESRDFNIFYDATTLIVICVKPMSGFVNADAWLAAENLMLAAYGMGLGTCVIGFAVAVLNMPDVKAELGIPREVTAIAPLIVGKPAGATVATPHKAPNVIAWK